jgi:caffeoyl-CoA O-methyltransferase
MWHGGGMSHERQSKSESYATQLFGTLPAWWNDVRDAGEQLRPGIQLAAYEAGLVAWLLRLHRAKRILEIGGFVGASALAMVEQVPNAQVVTLEREAAAATLARTHINAHAEGRITLMEGDALALLHSAEITQTAPFDAVFIDAEKRHYPQYLKAALPLLAPGALILADNTLLFGAMSGEQLRANVSAESKTAMAQFHTILADRTRFDTMLLSTLEGLTVALVKH